MDPLIWEHLEAYSMLEAIDRGRNCCGAYIFARDLERWRDNSKPLLAGWGGQPLTAISNDGHLPLSAVSDDNLLPPSAISDSN